MPLLYCTACTRYTLETICPFCHAKTSTKKPARFSPQDHYGIYRQKLKQLHKKG